MPLLREDENSIFSAISDVLKVVQVAEDAALELSASEIHSVCYFANILAGALDEAEQTTFNYAFSFGANGGPFSREIRDALNRLTQQGVVLEVRPKATSGDRFNYRLTDVGRESAGLFFQDSSSASVGALIVAVVNAMSIRTVPWVVNAIHREPSLTSARHQHMRTGVPLLQSSVFTDWIREVRHALDAHLGGITAEPEILIPFVLDILGEMN
jgi:hypothetical protein